MFKMVRILNAADKPTIVAALSAQGIKARVKVCHASLRVCFVGSQAIVLDVLNGLGFLNAAGGQFDMNSFNQPHEIFVHRAPL